MQDDLISIDKLEDQLIDHPDASTKKQLNRSLDETFQKKLNARAEQIANQNLGGNKETNKQQQVNRNIIGGSSGAVGSNYQFLITKSHLEYEYKDYNDLQVELSEWFAFNDFNLLRGLEELMEFYNETINKQMTDFGEANIEIEVLKQSIASMESASSMKDNKLSNALDVITYYSFGKYGGCENVEEQINQIIENNNVLFNLGLHSTLITLIQHFIDERIAIDKLSSDSAPLHRSIESNYFKLLTLFYFLINVFLQIKDTPEYKKLQDILNETDIISTIVKFIEHWKWKPNNTYRVRYLIFIIWKLILVEMGDMEHIKRCDDFLIEKHKIVNKRGKDLPENKLTCSPLDYFTFREDLMDKYPLYNDSNNIDKPTLYDFTNLRKELDDLSETSSIQENYQYFMAMNNYSNSLSNLIEYPRPNKSHTILSQLPTQTVHIATPVPSPPSTPSEYMSGGEKIRKSYQVNQGMPFIYPRTEEFDVPYAIKEADEIVKKSVYESYSNKRLWNERQKFMSQERGYVNEYENDDKNHLNNFNEFDYDDQLFEHYPNKKQEIQSILRVEKFYSNNLIRFHSLVQVLLETIKSNKFDYNLNFAEWELNPETSYFNSANFQINDKESRSKIESIIMQQLEVLNIKEVTLKASTSIILLLLKWFKINHVLKYNYLSSILFDQQFFNILLNYLNKSFNNPNLQKLNSKSSKDDEMVDYEIIINQNKLMNPKINLPNFEFFNNCLKKFPSNFKYEFINKDPISNLEKIADSNNINNVYIKHYNENFCFILTNLLNITNKILIKNITQRIFTFNDLKPSELFKMILINYNNKYLSKPILKVLKKLIPYQGRKWKSINMDLISSIYLNLKLTLKDNWLSGKDLENDFNNSYDQEIALRSLLQFYNIRRYEKQMEFIGYKISKDEDISILNLNEEDYYS